MRYQVKAAPNAKQYSVIQDSIVLKIKNISVSSKVEIKENKTREKGLFAKEKIIRNELVADFSKTPGKIITSEKANKLYENGGKFSHYIFQIDNNKFKAATRDKELGAAYFLNHSCDPNCGIKDTWKIVAMHNIGSDEELTFDYATSESADFEMKCHCGNRTCRKIITGKDWRIEELQRRYKGYFSDYLQTKIENSQKARKK